MEVNIVVEIMIPHNGRHPRHPTPFYPVPDIGPFDMYSDVAAMAIRIEWQKDDGQWISRPLTLTRTKLASSATGTGITTTKFGPEVEYMTMAWLRCVKFMGSLMQWEWQSKKPFVQLMVRYPGRVRCIETDFLGQKYVVSIADKIKRPEPKLLDLEQTAALLRKRYGSENMMIGLPPKKGWWAVPGEDMRGLINRTRCDMCVFSNDNRSKCTNRKASHEQGTEKFSCDLCKSLRRWCTWTRVANDRVHIEYPFLVVPFSLKYKLQGIPAPPINIDLLNIDSEEKDEDKAEAMTQVDEDEDEDEDGEE
ncbi:hypothetical protein DL546_006511 [Coniochaeta pulveracea]|uniref:Uncharacterized protein n=1 Tax=Coniochaeta pulveracea TaxID=177199 RepID=A0A420Y867_9PEZI|nr:hypothetical protein DL546_006511 [Coniochaeta pulveracea]